MIEVFSSTSDEGRCPYLHDRNWRMEYRYIVHLSSREYQDLLMRGWRRNGSIFFRPCCEGCNECRPLRVDVSTFAPTKSQRKCLRRNPDVQLTVQTPTVSADHIRLFNSYHRDMTSRRDWPLHTIDEEQYFAGFIDREFEFAREFVYRRDGKVIGIGLVDVVPAGTSSVYFYHDPEWRTLGPGTFSILQEIEYARSTGRPYVYLGYCVADCPSMAYKARFQPHSFLQEFVNDFEEPEWLASS